MKFAVHAVCQTMMWIGPVVDGEARLSRGGVREHEEDASRLPSLRADDASECRVDNGLARTDNRAAC
jgi:hypothetical protein